MSRNICVNKHSVQWSVYGTVAYRKDKFVLRDGSEVEQPARAHSVEMVDEYELRPSTKTTVSKKWSRVAKTRVGRKILF